MRHIKDNVARIIALIDEIKSYETYKENLLRKIDRLFSEYQGKRYTHEEYSRRMGIILEGKTKDEWLSYYDSYMFSLLKEIEETNYRIFYETYENKDFENIKPIPRAERKKESGQKSRSGLKTEPADAIIPDENARKKEETKEEKKDREIFDALVKIERKEQRKIDRIEWEEKERRDKELREKLKIPHPPKVPESLGKKTAIPEKFRKKSSTIGVGGTFGYAFVKNLMKRFSKTKESDKGKTLLDLKLKSKDESPLFSSEDASGFSTSIINEEAKRIKSILERRQTTNIYQPSFFGAIANILIKKVSFFLLDTFPDMFKALYNGLRLANIRVLSNTYVNIMVLFVFIASFITGPIVFFISAGKYTFMQAIARTAIMTLIIAATTAIGFYSYPFAKISERRRNINSNLPFAINHMAAVASSGVPPTRMFQLIAESPEYGEVSIEVAKIVEYIDLFGYDFLTALKSVAAISPSPAFKDFLEGLISTIESGGDIKSYLSEKADEAMLTYELERQKYMESISTYSDVYTGILIAAPLFFVTTLSMVSMLGGAIGGLDVNTVVFVGTYLVVPLLNVGFLMFLGMTQPEI